MELLGEYQWDGHIYPERTPSPFYHSKARLSLACLGGFPDVEGAFYMYITMYICVSSEDYGYVVQG